MRNKKTVLHSEVYLCKLAILTDVNMYCLVDTIGIRYLASKLSTY